MSAVTGIVVVSTAAIAGLVVNSAIEKGYRNIVVDVKNQKLELEKPSTKINSIEEN